MHPRPCFRITSPAAWHTKKGALRFTAIMASHSDRLHLGGALPSEKTHCVDRDVQSAKSVRDRANRAARRLILGHVQLDGNRGRESRQPRSRAAPGRGPP